TLGMIHSLWKPVPGRFKDYIAIPKPNMYQSLHTAMMGPRGERMEIQIRTEEMHRVAEEGIAAHWRYKEGKPVDEKEDRRLAWLRQLIEWQKELKDAGEFMETVKIDLFPEEVFVFTPKGDVKAFPVGATPVDFAYSVHTDVGHRCVAAKVNGRLVSLRYQLKNGDVVEIITSPHHHPSKDWLKFVKTSRARTKIRQWVKTEERAKSITLGKEICEKEFKRHGLDFYKILKSGEIEHLAREGFNMAGVDNLLAVIGYGKLSVYQVLGKLLPQEKLEILAEKEPSGFKRILQRLKKTPREAIVVKGIEDVMIKFGKCCNPLPGDRIVGFITLGKGVSVHTVDCPNILNADPERRMEVEWDKKLKATRPAKIEVICQDEKGVLADMSSTITSAEANISSANIRTTPDKKAICTFEVEVNDLAHLESIIKGLQKIKRVLRVERVRA
ncbi:MAG: bifunctional (p)ppGpp synthetase/guanosine-3',5'-bis(diphosphate) 3'-pyrophosphohydrolase, partial [Deltaproteobacteria bacterium]|nr:bifunctional (p)ppGpp synthetase/guanosine-3',5'-bis(diphosphate) 3'-pyrophosphohydrolase [Deltaproteobacteria bacterium]